MPASERARSLLLLVAAACARADGGAAEAGPWVRAPQGYSVRGWTRVAPGRPDTLTFGIRVANLGSLPARYTLGECAVQVRLYRRADLAGAPAWDSHPTHDPDCSALPIQRPLAPGDTMPTSLYSAAFTAAQILGDSLPPGRYYVSVGSPLDVDARLRVPAGSVRLER